MRRMIGDAKGSTKHLGHAGPSPEGAAEAPGFRAAVQQRRNLGTLGGRQARGRAGRGATAYCVNPSFLGAAEPLAHRPLGYPQGRRNRLLGPPVVPEFPGAKPPSFAPVSAVLSRSQGCHAGKIQPGSLIDNQIIR